MILTKEKTFSHRKIIILYYYINNRSEKVYNVLGIYCIQIQRTMRKKEARKKERWERNNLRTSIRSCPNFKANEGKSSQKLYIVFILELMGLFLSIKTLKYGCYITVVFIAINFKPFLFQFCLFFWRYNVPTVNIYL